MPGVMQEQSQILYSKNGHHNISPPMQLSRALLSPAL